jgi:hypothetical protein
MLRTFISKPRHARPKELYAHLWWDTRIEPTFRQEVIKTQARGEPPIKAVSRAIDICWEEESDDFKTKLMENLETMYREQLRNWDGLVGKVDGIAIEPKERQR